jgi:hypothetical protein
MKNSFLKNKIRLSPYLMRDINACYKDNKCNNSSNSLALLVSKIKGPYIKDILTVGVAEKRTKKDMGYGG